MNSYGKKINHNKKENPRKEFLFLRDVWSNFYSKFTFEWKSIKLLKIFIFE